MPKNQHRTTHWAHPRMRGENDESGLSFTWSWGSSPHARGKPPQELPQDQIDRLIPACAGKTSPYVRRSNRDWAHPRMRGENRVPLRIVRLLVGSSPHARGKQVEIEYPDSVKGLIPACAGKTRKPGTHGRAPGAHPRMRGENSQMPLALSAIQGSSPHARGKRQTAND